MVKMLSLNLSFFFFKILLTGSIPTPQEYRFNLRKTCQGLRLDCPESPQLTILDRKMFCNYVNIFPKGILTEGLHPTAHLKKGKMAPKMTVLVIYQWIISSLLLYQINFRHEHDNLNAATAYLWVVTSTEHQDIIACNQQSTVLTHRTRLRSVM